jgi:hypothetical protein
MAGFVSEVFAARGEIHPRPGSGHTEWIVVTDILVSVPFSIAFFKERYATGQDSAFWRKLIHMRG